MNMRNSIVMRILSRLQTRRGSVGGFFTVSSIVAYAIRSATIIGDCNLPFYLTAASSDMSYDPSRNQIKKLIEQLKIIRASVYNVWTKGFYTLPIVTIKYCAGQRYCSALIQIVT